MSAFHIGQRVRILPCFPNKSVHGDEVIVLATDAGRTFPIRTTKPGSAPSDCVHLGSFLFRERELEAVPAQPTDIWPPTKQDIINDLESSR